MDSVISNTPLFVSCAKDPLVIYDGNSGEEVELLIYDSWIWDEWEG